MYVTYDLCQDTRGSDEALYPKVKRVYIAGDVKDWDVGTFTKRSGKDVHGVKIDYEQGRQAIRARATRRSAAARYITSQRRTSRGANRASPGSSKCRKTRRT